MTLSKGMRRLQCVVTFAQYEQLRLAAYKANEPITEMVRKSIDRTYPPAKKVKG